MSLWRLHSAAIGARPGLPPALVHRAASYSADDAPYVEYGTRKIAAQVLSGGPWRNSGQSSSASPPRRFVALHFIIAACIPLHDAVAARAKPVLPMLEERPTRHEPSVRKDFQEY